MKFCFFIGYSASGHSVIGAIIDAHRNAIVSHEIHAIQLIIDGMGKKALFDKIKTQSASQSRNRCSAKHTGKGKLHHHSLGLHQGKAENIRIIGDKRGGATSMAFISNTKFKLEKVRKIISIPLKVILISRNPYDIASITGVQHIIDANIGIRNLIKFLNEDEIIYIKSEELIRSPRNTIIDLCHFLELEPYEEFLDICSNHVFENPSEPRHNCEWSILIKKAIKGIIDECKWFQGYKF